MSDGLKLTIVPCTIAEAKAWIRIMHRHHGPPVSANFAVAVADEQGLIRGVATAGRPVARLLNDGFTIEITRVATDGVKNGCSALYAAAWRAARSLGYKRAVTYILASETGVSVRAAGWREVARTRGKTWNTPSRPRLDTIPPQPKLRFEVCV